jgi:RNA polymerase sigma-70 factor, ECF subfamily
VIRRAWPDAVDDVLADTFLIAWRRLESIPGDPLPWLFNTARNCLSNHRRGALRGAALLTRLAAEPAPPAPDELDRAAKRDSILRALARLNDLERELVMLADWDGLTPTQIAEMLVISPVVSRARLHRARRKLRDALDEELARAHPEPLPRSVHDPA